MLHPLNDLSSGCVYGVPLEVGLWPLGISRCRGQPGRELRTNHVFEQGLAPVSTSRARSVEYAMHSSSHPPMDRQRPSLRSRLNGVALEYDAANTLVLESMRERETDDTASSKVGYRVHQLFTA